MEYVYKRDLIFPEKLGPLSQRSGVRAWRQLLSHFGAIGASGGLLHLLWSIPGCRLKRTSPATRGRSASTLKHVLTDQQERQQQQHVPDSVLVGVRGDPVAQFHARE